MIKVNFKLPRDIAVAVSGGVDSVAVLDFLSNNHNVTIVHVNHKEGNSDAGEEFVTSLADKYNVPLVSKSISSNKPKQFSREEWWRTERYKVFHSMKMPVITAHTLDDCVETWVWTSMHGVGKIIPKNNKNVFRPFRTTVKDSFISWAKKNDLCWLEDESNSDLTLTRNYIRKIMMPSVLTVNPGIYKTIFKKVIND